MRDYRISFCTVAMGRLDHLRQTLPGNIASAQDYPNCEFVLLDYGSRDGLADWVKSNCMHWINSGKLTYLRIDGPVHFDGNHARNSCFLASTGSVLCNLDADNFLLPGFAPHLNELMNRHPRAMANFGRTPGSTRGRLAMFRRDFTRVGGYNESFYGYGWDDKDLRARLLASRCRMQWLDSKFAAFISHGDDRRVENYPPELSCRRQTGAFHKFASCQAIKRGCRAANIGRRWGEAAVTVNFARSITTQFHSPSTFSPPRAAS